MPVSPATIARAERVEDAVDERDGVAVLVDDGEVGGVGARPDLAVGRRIDGLVRIDQRPPRRRVVLRQQLLHRHLRERGVGDVAVAIRKGNLRRLDQRVVVALGLALERRQVDGLENVQQQERRQTLSVRRQLVERVSAIGRRDRLDPLRLLRGEVLHREESAVLLAVVHDRAADLAAIEGVAPAFGQRAERPREVLLDEDRARLAGRRRRPGTSPRPRRST